VAVTLAQQVPGRCDTWRQRHPWDHNAHHHGWILRRLPHRIDRALDVGCATGELARRLVAGTVATWRRGFRGRGRPSALDARTAVATATLAEVHRVAARELPGAVLRRHLLWRFSLVSTAPAL
jgi:hypothetical protein